MSHERNIEIEASRLEELLRKCFPSHALGDYGTTSFDYLVGNIRAAVVEEIIAVVECWLETLEEASHYTALQRGVPKRDWEVAKAHILDLLSEIKQYKTRGMDNHTGEVRTIDTSKQS